MRKMDQNDANIDLLGHYLHSTIFVCEYVYKDRQKATLPPKVI